MSMTDDEQSYSTLQGDEANSSERVLEAIRHAEKAFRDWQAVCDEIDDSYSLLGAARQGLLGQSWSDARFDLFWASFEILKPAVYARPPVPAVAPIFSDSKPILEVTSELLERVSISTLARTGMHDVMREVRDDLIFGGRGVPWVRYEAGGGKQKICVEHADRKDFLHEPARYWTEVGWVARRHWLSKEDMKKRFQPHSGDAYLKANYGPSYKRGDTHDNELRGKAGVWEVWHKADNRVYWVTEGVDVLLDSGKPHLDLESFWPCPRPAYGTLQRRKLIPVPDWERYAIHFRKISELTGRIYVLLDSIRMKGLIPAGGDVGDAIEQAIRSNDDQIVIPVPAAALAGNASNFVVWLPLAELAQAITGLIEARGQLIEDFYQLSGISDIMRGATEASETLGAQRLKSQYGSVRVQEKVAELQRVAADTVKIVAEIIAEKFTPETLLEMSQMDILRRRDIDKRIKEIEDAAHAELEAFGKTAQQQAVRAQQAGQQVDPAQIEQAMKEAQGQIVSKYADMLAEAQALVPLEDVVALLRDDRARSFAFTIASDSTILQDEMATQAARNEFLTAFSNASMALQGVAAQGTAGAELAGELLKFVLSAHRAGRTLSAAIDNFVKQAPQIAAQAQEGEGENEALAQANAKLAEAEMEKARAQMARVEADAIRDQAEMQRKMAALEQKAQADQARFAAEAEKLRQQAEQNAVKAEEALAKVDLIRAQTMKALAEAGVVIDRQNLDEFRSLADIELRANDQQQRAIDREVAQANRQEDRADAAVATSEGAE